MKYLDQYIGQMIEIELSSKKRLSGKLVEYGSDIVIVFNGQNFYYIPVTHVVFITKSESIENEVINDAPTPIVGDKLSLQKILTNAKGIFVEVLIAGNQSVYGYITQIKNDYVAFHSPSFKTILIQIAHMKWITPYLDRTPYLVEPKKTLLSSNLDLADSFEEQVTKLKGEVVIFDLGKDPNKIGLIKNSVDQMVELATGNGQVNYLNQTHIKTVHGPIIG